MSREERPGELGSLARRLRAQSRGDSPVRPDPADVEPTSCPPPAGPDREAAAALLDRARRASPVLYERLQRLDPWQIAAVASRVPAALVCAQVGSGKTTVLVDKVLSLVALDGVRPERIAVLTFTNKAAGELHERLGAFGSAFDPDSTRWIGTFHSVALSLLQSSLPVEELGFESDVRVLDPEGREQLWRRLIHVHGLNVKYRARLERRLEALKRGKPLYGAMRKADDIGALSEHARREKVAGGLMDFDDLLVSATELLERGRLENPPEWVLVDELQDCDGLQHRFVRALAGPETRVFAVGDPNQVIYAWRGASPKLFETFVARWDARTYALPVNYRSQASIVGASRRLLGRAALSTPTDVRVDDVVASRGPGERLRVIAHHSPPNEARYVAARIAERVRQGARASEFAVLYRVRRQAAAVGEALDREGITWVEHQRAGQYRQPAVRWVGRLLRSILAGRDVWLAYDALVDPQYGVLSERHFPAEWVRAYREEHSGGDSVVEVLRAALATGPERAKRRSRAAERARAEAGEALDCWAAFAAQLDAPSSLSAAGIFEALQLARRIRPTSSRYEGDRRAVLEALEEWLEVARAVPNTPLSTGLGPIVDRALAGGLHHTQAIVEEEGVRLLTLHASKGLEFQHVFIVSANDGWLPLGGRSVDYAALEEEKRLLFVGLTRASESVEISYCTAPEQPRITADPSPFLRLLPTACVEWFSHPPEIAAPEPAEEATDSSPPEPAWSDGQVVTHGKYGHGVIVAVDATSVRVEFETFGEKSFLVALCPLQRVDHTVP